MLPPKSVCFSYLFYACLSLGISSWPLHDKCSCNHFHRALRSSCLQQVLALQLLPSIGWHCYSVITSPLLPWHRMQAMHLHTTFHLSISSQLFEVCCHHYVVLQACCHSGFCVCIICAGVQRDCANMQCPISCSLTSIKTNDGTCMDCVHAVHTQFLGISHSYQPPDTMSDHVHTTCQLGFTGSTTNNSNSSSQTAMT